MHFFFLYIFTICIFVVSFCFFKSSENLFSKLSAHDFCFFSSFSFSPVAKSSSLNLNTSTLSNFGDYLYITKNENGGKGAGKERKGKKDYFFCKKENNFNVFLKNFGLVGIHEYINSLDKNNNGNINSDDNENRNEYTNGANMHTKEKNTFSNLHQHIINFYKYILFLSIKLLYYLYCVIILCLTLCFFCFNFLFNVLRILCVDDIADTFMDFYEDLNEYAFDLPSYIVCIFYCILNFFYHYFIFTPLWFIHNYGFIYLFSFILYIFNYFLSFCIIFSECIRSYTQNVYETLLSVPLFCFSLLSSLFYFFTRSCFSSFLDVFDSFYKYFTKYLCFFPYQYLLNLSNYFSAFSLSSFSFSFPFSLFSSSLLPSFSSSVFSLSFLSSSFSFSSVFSSVFVSLFSFFVSLFSHIFYYFKYFTCTTIFPLIKKSLEYILCSSAINTMYEYLCAFIYHIIMYPTQCISEYILNNIVFSFINTLYIYIHNPLLELFVYVYDTFFVPLKKLWECIFYEFNNYTFFSFINIIGECSYNLLLYIYSQYIFVPINFCISYIINIFLVCFSFVVERVGEIFFSSIFVNNYSSNVLLCIVFLLFVFSFYFFRSKDFYFNLKKTNRINDEKQKNYENAITYKKKEKQINEGKIENELLSLSDSGIYEKIKKNYEKNILENKNVNNNNILCNNKLCDDILCDKKYEEEEDKYNEESDYDDYDYDNNDNDSYEDKFEQHEHIENIWSQYNDHFVDRYFLGEKDYHIHGKCKTKEELEKLRLYLLENDEKYFKFYEKKVKNIEQFRQFAYCGIHAEIHLEEQDIM